MVECNIFASTRYNIINPFHRGSYEMVECVIGNDFIACQTTNTTVAPPQRV